MSENEANEEIHEPIRGVVAALVNERELVINRGSAHGVARGMRFQVLTESDLEIYDPETGESLGNITRVKVRVEARIIQEKMSICRTYETLRSSVFPSIARGLTETQYRTIRVGDEGFLPPIAENESYVKVGDPVEEIV
jgi:hypothetical protein